MFPAGYTHKNALPKRSVSSRTISDYSPFGVLLHERSVNTADFRYGFQGQEEDDEVKGEGNSINFNYRMHDPRVGRFFAVDPLAYQFPFNSSYAFSENRVIDGIDFEGSEYYYSASGTLLGKLGTSQEVRIINAERIQKYGGEENYKKALGKVKPGSETHLKWVNSDKVSKSAGINNNELMLRATLTTIRKAEGHGTMEVYNRDEIGTLFTEDQTPDINGSLSEDPGYDTHPGSNQNDAEGAYQMKKVSFQTARAAANSEISQEFIPVNQDAAAVVLITEQQKYNPSTKGDLFKNIYNGDVEAWTKQLNRTWTSLPGGREEGIKLEKAKEYFKEAIKNELSGDSSIATPRGSLKTPNP